MKNDYHLITTEGVIVRFHRNNSSSCEGCVFYRPTETDTFNCRLMDDVADATDDDDELCIDKHGIWIQAEIN